MSILWACSFSNTPPSPKAYTHEQSITKEEKPDFAYPEALTESGIPVKPEYNIEDNAYPSMQTTPWGGTVSHHMLTAPYIDSWFTELKNAMPEIARFFIISPGHFADGSEKISLSNKNWEVPGFKSVYSSPSLTNDLKETLDVPWDHNAFIREHGIAVLLPFIRYYYPDAEIIPILQKERPIPSKEIHMIADFLVPFFKHDARDNSFLMVSTDFVHHLSIEETIELDKLSKKLFDDFELKNWALARNDNQGGLLLALLIGKSINKNNAWIQYHLNNTHIIPEAKDITSYFFTFFY